MGADTRIETHTVDNLLGIQSLLSQILFYVFILNRGLFVIDKFHFFRDDVHGIDLIMLCQQNREG